MRSSILFLLLLLSTCGCSATPLFRAHAHNDYLHTHPLYDALAHGFCSIEADVHLIDDTLYVAHDAKDIRPDRTLASLYLDPLRRRIRANHGTVYRNGPSIILLIDLKTDPIPTYLALKKLLTNYTDLLTTFTPTAVHEGPITIILTGNKPRDLIAAEPTRPFACDGVLSDLDTNPPTTFIPLISDNWKDHFTWRGAGPMPNNERTKLRDIATRAHAQHRKLRFWGSPDTPAAWRELLAADVDLINTDNLPGLRKFLLHR